MYDVGYNIEIGGRTGEIVFKTNYEGEDYIIVSQDDILAVIE